MSEKERRRDELRMKTGRSKLCFDCKKHRCDIASCNCECHKEISRSSGPRVFRHINSKKCLKPRIKNFSNF